MADLLDLAHSGAEDVVDVSLRIFQRSNCLRADHAAVCNDTEPANVEPIPNPLDDGNQRGYIRCVAGPHLTAYRLPLVVKNSANDHLVQIGATVLAVALLAECLAPSTLEADGGRIEEDKIKAGEQVTTLEKKRFFDQVLGTPGRKGGGISLVCHYLPQEGHGPIQMMQAQPIHTFYGVVTVPFVTRPVRARDKEPMKDGEQDRPLEIEPELPFRRKATDHAFDPELFPQSPEDECRSDLDFHTVPHYGEESVLEEHWAATRGKRMKGALTLFAQDASSKLILYTAADIKRSESDEQALAFLSFWKTIRRGVASTLIFDSKFTTYAKLSQLNDQGIKFITLRRRGKELVANVDNLAPWQRIHIPHVKRKYHNPHVHHSIPTLRGYEGELRQIVVRGNGREEPTFLISNDFDSPAELIVGNYARRWRVENTIAEAVKFFHLNALSSPILVKVHFDVIMTMMADTLYSMLAQKLRGFEHCDAAKLYRHFARGKGSLKVRGNEVVATYPRRAHSPIR